MLFYWIGNLLQNLICGGLANTGNLFLDIIGKSENFKIFPDNINLILFSRHDNNLSLNPNFTYATSDISTHFILPNVLFIALIIALLKPWKSKIKPFIYGSILINLFFVFKFIVAVINNETKQIILDKTGKMIDQVDGTDIWFKIFDLLNNLLNKYGSIGMRPLIVVVIWVFVSYSVEEITTFFYKKK